MVGLTLVRYRSESKSTTSTTASSFSNRNRSSASLSPTTTVEETTCLSLFGQDGPPLIHFEFGRSDSVGGEKPEVIDPGRNGRFSWKRGYSWIFLLDLGIRDFQVKPIGFFNDQAAFNDPIEGLSFKLQLCDQLGRKLFPSIVAECSEEGSGTLGKLRWP